MAGFARIAKTPTARSLVGVFLGDQAVKKIAKGHARGARPVKRAAVLGAGRDCLGDFLNANGTAVIAAFAVVLALSTVLLWSSTRNAAHAARAAADAFPQRLAGKIVHHVQGVITQHH